ncbi:DUF2306 domain-containing protein [Micromonospora robiginosa]|uniref:DUF2306 domain-containing protein n=1 Tax=Micromonospora robiginosa TaxID=2749844 RepID=A0A7L6BF09_9ACTN|nr:DUF2306 domain-containing protein [Micromonospora ferruginea]QLQ40375.2 DUF2306 domain-containing protein [Micromonospora ferruginea]
MRTDVDIAPSTPVGGRRPRRQLRGMVPLLLVAVAFVGYALPPYLTLDPSRSRLPAQDAHPQYYPLLVTHIVFGSVALLAGCLQVWPWFRRRHPVAHRRLGRVYLFGGVFPAGVAVLGVAPLSSTGFVSQVGNTVLAVLWLATAVAGYRTARRRRFAEHRRWMVRNYALTLSIVLNRLWLVLFVVLLLPRVDTTFGGDQDAMIRAAAGASVWMSWVVNLLVAEWWLERGRTGPVRARRTGPVTGSGTGAQPRTTPEAPTPERPEKMSS